mmetsp:Transcript_9851/g.20924  ORF Transcript_9851/g.20924 Transcript_9851/m.20924 type:complete len:357 (-) Transcript_9851:788-1858(-)
MASHCSSSKARSKRAQSSGRRAKKARNSSSVALPSLAAQGPTWAKSVSRDMPFWRRYSRRASTIMLLMLATMKTWPPPSRSSADISVVLATASSRSRMPSLASRSSLWARRRFSCSFAFPLALVISTRAAVRRAVNCVSSVGSNFPLLSLCLSIRNCQAPSTALCAAFSASPTCSQSSLEASADNSHALGAVRGAAIWDIFCTASSASTTFCKVSLCIASHLRLSTFFSKRVSFSSASLIFFERASTACICNFDTTGSKPRTSTDLDVREVRAKEIAFCSAPAISSGPAKTLVNSSAARVAKLLASGTLAPTICWSTSSTFANDASASFKIASLKMRSCCSFRFSFTCSFICPMFS